MSDYDYDHEMDGIPFFSIRGFTGFAIYPGRIVVIDYGPEDVRQSGVDGVIALDTRVLRGIPHDDLWGFAHTLMFGYENEVYPTPEQIAEREKQEAELPDLIAKAFPGVTVVGPAHHGAGATEGGAG